MRQKSDVKQKNPVLSMVDILLQGNGQKMQRFHSGETNSA